MSWTAWTRRRPQAPGPRGCCTRRPSSSPGRRTCSASPPVWCRTTSGAGGCSTSGAPRCARPRPRPRRRWPPSPPPDEGAPAAPRWWTAGGTAVVPGGASVNRFEKAVYECMRPTAELLDRTTSPLQRAILLNWWRHVHLEGAGEFERIVAPDMMVEHPVYRVTWGANPKVIEGKDGVLGFCKSVGEAVLWHSDDRISVGDWGVSDELTFHQLARGADLQAIGYGRREPRRPLPRGAALRPTGEGADTPAALSQVPAGQASTCPHAGRARLAGEHLYEDKTSL